MQMYIAGTLMIPLLIGLLVNTKDNEYWKQNSAANSKLVRLYTYQGAAIGFQFRLLFYTSADTYSDIICSSDHPFGWRSRQ